jgi:hypothetical protein
MQSSVMEIIVEIALDADGRLVGVIRAVGGGEGEGLSFSGSMELLARLEAVSGKGSYGSPEEVPRASSEATGFPFQP